MKYENETIKWLYERASVRAFEEKKIPDDVLKTILDAGCHAATGGNLQPYSIIKICSDEKKKALMDTDCMQSIVEKAPVNLLFTIDWHRIERWANAHKAPFVCNDSYRHFWIALQDTIIAAQSICTAADSMGLGSVYLGTVESCFDELKDIFKLPKGVFPVVIVSLGFPKKYPEPAAKLMSEIIVHDEEYRDIPMEELDKAMDEKYSGRAKTALSDRNVDKLYEVAKNVHGEQFAQEAVNYAKEIGYIHPVQRYFGLNYCADWSAVGNGDFLKSLENYGFGWIKGKDIPEQE